MNRSKTRTTEFLLAALPFILILAVCLLFAGRKQGMFIDEVYSYGLANSSFAPFLSDVKGGSVTGQFFTREDFENYLTVGEDDGFAFASVYYNQTRDVHPPLYYWLLNVCCSLFFRGQISKWAGLAVNIIFHLASSACLYALVLELYGSRKAAAATAALFGLSVLAMSAAMMIRMYAVMTFFTVLLALVCAKITANPEKKIFYPLFMLVLFLGLMTQYFFVFYAFFLCAAFVIRALVKKEFRPLGRFCIFAFGGVALMVAVFPASLKHIFVGNGEVVGGSSLTESLKDTSAYLRHIESFRKCEYYLWALRVALIALLAVAAVLFIARAAKRSASHHVSNDCIGRSAVIILPAQAAFFAVAIIAPVRELRYIYNLTPIFMLFAAFLFFLCESFAQDVMPEKAHSASFSLLSLCLIALALFGAKRIPPEYLFTEMADYDAAVAECSSDPCVYFTDGYFSPLTQDALQLMKFDSVYVTDSVSDPAIENYIGTADEIAVYVDTNSFWSSGFSSDEFISDLAERYGFSESRIFYEYDFEYTGSLSEAFILSDRQGG